MFLKCFFNFHIDVFYNYVSASNNRYADDLLQQEGNQCNGDDE